jgi:hypothetical protein
MAHKIPFLVAELGPDVDPFVLHLFAALAEKERALIATRTRQALSAATARGVTLGNPRLHVARKKAVALCHCSACQWHNNLAWIRAAPIAAKALQWGRQARSGLGVTAK